MTPRVPPGRSDGGQFAATPRDEPDVTLVAVQGRRELLSGLADDLFFRERPPTTDELAAAAAEARSVLGSLSDVEFEHRWTRVVDAARKAAAFCDEQGGFELVSGGALSEEDSCGVDLDDFTEVNMAMPEGHPGRLGYDLRGYADAIASSWGIARHVRVVDAVDADDVAAAVRDGEAVRAI